MRIGRVRQYAGVLAIPEGVSGPVRVQHVCYPAGHVLQTGTARTAFLGQGAPETIRFDQPTTWHELSERGHGVWMTDLPIEQRQTDDLVQAAHGRVLVGGLGLGYAVVALSARLLVREIVVVERSVDVIALVAAATRTRLVRPVPVSIIQADLAVYLHDLPRGRRPAFHYGLFDIWQSDSETTFHTVVVPLRAAAAGVVRQLVCWNEDVMRAQLYNGLRTRRAMLEAPPQGFGTLVDLDRLCATSDSLYDAWAVPFWRWYRAHRHLPADAVTWVMREYVATYGRPEVAHVQAALLHTGPPAVALHAPVP